ncbi:MAG TPA: phosphatidylglycerophosphatase A [Pyrinomonadaceae bacterium]|nr:phosphatidylglycerophosphatase A [Pyrinomonadaceae bacterium]
MKKRPSDYLALAIATCGVGYLPLAPGTWGSLVGVALFVEVHSFLIHELSRVMVQHDLDPVDLFYGVLVFESLVVIAIALAGTWAASRTERISGKKDPGKVVIDEVVGQFIALMPLALRPRWAMVILAFILFRFFDIVKPYPARRFESLHGGLGIMADDVVAGMYAAVFVAVAVVISWFV